MGWKLKLNCKKKKGQKEKSESWKMEASERVEFDSGSE